MDILFLVAPLAHRILTWLLDFWNICESLLYGIGSRVVIFRPVSLPLLTVAVGVLSFPVARLCVLM
jgi:predicted membrane protein